VLFRLVYRTLDDVAQFNVHLTLMGSGRSARGHVGSDYGSLDPTAHLLNSTA